MHNLGLSKYFSIVLLLMVVSLAFKDYNVIISNKSVAMTIMCKLSFNVRILYEVTM